MLNYCDIILKYILHKEGVKMAVFEKNKKSVFKDIAVNKEFVENAESNTKTKTKKTKGRSKITHKRDKTYTFYCTQDELDEIEKLANERHLTIAEYFRFKLFN